MSIKKYNAVHYSHHMHRGNDSLNTSLNHFLPLAFFAPGFSFSSPYGVETTLLASHILSAQDDQPTDLSLGPALALGLGSFRAPSLATADDPGRLEEPIQPSLLLCAKHLFQSQASSPHPVLTIKVEYHPDDQSRASTDTGQRRLA